MDTIVVQNSGLDIADIDGEKAMMDLEKGKYFMLNGIGSIVWDIISKPCSVKEIVSDLIAEYDVETATCEESILEFLGRLNNAELISIK